MTALPQGMSAFLSAYPGYSDTRRLDDLRAAEYGYLDATGQVYLDYAGAGLPAQRQLREHAARLRAGCFGNPHSDSPTSVATTSLVAQTRTAILDYFRASPDEYEAIFTPNATGACRLVGEAYPFRTGSRLVLTQDNHNSVNGIREFARSRGAVTEYVPLRPGELRVDQAALSAALARRGRPVVAGRRRHDGRRGLFAYPAQSNFTGVQHPLSFVELGHRNGFDVLLDAAAYLPTNGLDLSAVHPEFVTVSWYKLFGYPTGVGCLIARREALSSLRRPWFAGGTIKAVSALGGWHVLAEDESAFEDGTLNFLGIPDVHVGLEWIREIGIDLIQRRVTCLTGWLLRRLAALRHSDGRPMVEVYGPADTDARGGTVAFNILDPEGRVVDERVVSRDASREGISLRTGCFCNPGAAEAAFGLSRRHIRRALVGVQGTLEDFLARLGLPSGGALRISLGIASTVDDVERFARFAEDSYRDRVPDMAGLRPRQRC